MTRALSIRTYTEADRQAVIDLSELNFPQDPVWNKPDDIIDNKIAFQPDWFFLCYCDGYLAGTVLVGYDGVRGWVHKVATHPNFKRRGVASALMTAAEDALRDVGCVKLNLQVRAGNDSAVAFYKSAGYQIEDRINMAKRLETASH